MYNGVIRPNAPIDKVGRISIAIPFLREMGKIGRAAEVAMAAWKILKSIFSGKSELV